MSTFDHPIRDFLQRQWKASGLALPAFAARLGVTAGALGSYLRGDRTPPTTVLASMLDQLGYDLAPVPKGTAAGRTRSDWAAELRELALALDGGAA